MKPYLPLRHRERLFYFYHYCYLNSLFLRERVGEKG
jgi:hypothetical protein